MSATVSVITDASSSRKSSHLHLVIVSALYYFSAWPLKILPLSYNIYYNSKIYFEQY